MNRGEKAELSSYEDYTRKSGNYDKDQRAGGYRDLRRLLRPRARTVEPDGGA